ncbi:MAG: hypothetical protein AABX66_00910 [Nanoarchaeota archaeon]
MTDDSKNYNEIEDEINSALADSRGLLVHKRRLAFCLSSGIAELLEKYLQKKKVLKVGYKINHQTLGRSRENVKVALADKITAPIDSLDKLDRILDIANKIESTRNIWAYGGKASEEDIMEAINLFLEIKKEVEND